MDFFFRLESDVELSSWVATQRRLKGLGQLSEGKITKLETIDFVWSDTDLTWDRMYKQLVEYPFTK